MRVVMSAIWTSGEPLSVGCVRLSSMTLVLSSFVSIPLSGGRHASRCHSRYARESVASAYAAAQCDGEARDGGRPPGLDTPAHGARPHRWLPAPAASLP